MPESQRAREPESQRAREPESQRAREPESQRAREQNSQPFTLRAGLSGIGEELFKSHAGGLSSNKVLFKPSPSSVALRPRSGLGSDSREPRLSDVGLMRGLGIDRFNM